MTDQPETTLTTTTNSGVLYVHVMTDAESAFSDANRAADRAMMYGLMGCENDAERWAAAAEVCSLRAHLFRTADSIAEQIRAIARAVR